MRSVTRALLTLALLVVPASLRAQCAIDLIAEGVTAYRDLDLVRAQERLRDALEAQGRASPGCATEGARALTYLGASYWLLAMPDSAMQAFERAVIQAPRFEPDAFEFPPDITQTFDRVRSRTPAVAVTVPSAVTLGPRAGETLAVRLAASTSHWITAALRASDGEHVRTLYDGPVASGSTGMVVEWDGRDGEGDPVRSGAYDLEIISADSLSTPVRKVVVPLTVESDARVEPAAAAPDTALVAALAPPRPRGGVWSAVAAAGAGLAAGALVVAVPPAIAGFPESEARWVVGGSLGVAGIIGFVQRFRRRPRAAPEPVVPERVAPADPAERDPGPTLRIRAGTERRIEMADEGASGLGPWGAAPGAAAGTLPGAIPGSAPRVNAAAAGAGARN